VAQKVGLVFVELHITENTVAVSKNLIFEKHAVR